MVLEKTLKSPLDCKEISPSYGDLSWIFIGLAPGPITSWEIDGETVETVSDFIFLGSKITADGTAAMKLKDAYSLEGKL